MQDEVRGFHLEREVFSRFAGLARHAARHSSESSECFLPGILSTLMLADGARRMTWPLATKDFLHMAQATLTKCRAPMEFSQFFQTPWPLWEAVDWLQTDAEAPSNRCNSNCY